MMRGVIFANGEISDLSYIKGLIQPDDYIICLDGGLRYCDELALRPHCIAGDFDSVDKGLLEKYRQLGVEIHQYPVDKDWTDMELGLELAGSKGLSRVILAGALGKRTDHLLGNLLNMVHALSKGLEAVIAEKGQLIYIICDRADFIHKVGTTVSLIPIAGIAEGITTDGFKFPLVDEDLFPGFSRGISNVVIEDTASVELRKGVLLVIETTDV